MKKNKALRYRETGGYECPACGTCCTEIVGTLPFTNNVIRKRHCLLCDYSHETIECLASSHAMLKNARNISVQDMQSQAQ